MKTLTRFPSLLRPLLPLLCCLLLVTACQEDGVLVPFPVGGRDTVLAWNKAGTVAVARMSDPTTGFFILPHPEARIYAVVNLAMHDALNNIQRRYAPYALQGPLMPLASPDAAVSTAAHDALVAVLPEQKTYADSLYQVSLAAIRDGQAKTQGIALGRAAAQAVLATRVGDKSDVAQIPYTPGTNPGDYQFTPPFDGPPFNGFLALAGWRDVTPFALRSAAQFRRVPPPALTSDAYAADVNEIQALGGATSTQRTAEQSAIALYWLDSSPLQWNRIARSALATHPQSAHATARLLALLQMAEADAYIAMSDTKLAFPRWRPYTAILKADTDNNPNTTADATWVPFAFPTPPDPDYVSGHAVAGGAASAVLRNFFGTDAVPFAITNNAGQTRGFAGFGPAATENSVSRIYTGYHTRTAVVQGQAMGEQIGAYVFQTKLR